LRRERELLGISLQDIAQATKISSRMLRDLEDERFDQLPGGVFTKGFVRAYARCVGISEDYAIELYMAALSERQIQSQSLLPDLTSGTPSASSLPEIDGEGRPAPASAALGSIPPADAPAPAHEPDSIAPMQNSLLPLDPGTTHERGAVSQAPDSPGEHSPAEDSYSEPSRWQEEEEPLGQISSHAPLPPVPATLHNSRRLPWEKIAALILMITALGAFWNHRRNLRTAAASSPFNASPASSPAAVPIAQDEALHGGPLVGAELRSPVPNEARNEVRGDLPAGHPNPIRHSRRKFTLNEPPRFTLLIRASQTARVSITADGQPVAQETLIAPAHTTVRATREIVVQADNPSGIQFRFNGKDIRPQSTPPGAQTYTFGATGLRIPSAPQPPSPPD
jgi:hypothetical protein